MGFILGMFGLCMVFGAIWGSAYFMHTHEADKWTHGPIIATTIAFIVFGIIATIMGFVLAFAPEEEKRRSTMED